MSSSVYQSGSGHTASKAAHPAQPVLEAPWQPLWEALLDPCIRRDLSRKKLRPCVWNKCLCVEGQASRQTGESANTGTCFDPTGKWQESYWVTGFTLSCSMWTGAKRETVFLKNTGGREGAGRDKQLEPGRGAGI